MAQALRIKRIRMNLRFLRKSQTALQFPATKVVGFQEGARIKGGLPLPL